MAQIKNQSVPLDSTTKLFGVNSNIPGEAGIEDVLRFGEGGRLRNIVYITESGNYEKPAWLKFVRTKIVAGGGGSGGCAATGAGELSVSSGGGGGGYAEKRIEASDLAASETVTIGAGGEAGAVGASTGGTGGVTSFGSHITVAGGSGGVGTAASTGVLSIVGGAGGAEAGSGADISASGLAGEQSRAIAGGPALPGLGGLSHIMLFGAGGNGRAVAQSSAAIPGRVGNPGIVIIEEYE